MEKIDDIAVYSKMLCPHCGAIFPLTESEQYDFPVMWCPNCTKYNWGSCSENEAGVLIGERYLDCEGCGKPLDSDELIGQFAYNNPNMNVTVTCQNCGEELWM